MHLPVLCSHVYSMGKFIIFFFVPSPPTVPVWDSHALPLQSCIQKDVLDLCPRYFDEIPQVFDVEIPKPKQQVEQEQDVDRINE